MLLNQFASNVTSYPEALTSGNEKKSQKLSTYQQTRLVTRANDPKKLLDQVWFCCPGFEMCIIPPFKNVDV